MASPLPKPRVFTDADVLFAGAASPGEHGASLLILRMAEIGLIEAFASRQVITEAERNLAENRTADFPRSDKLRRALPAFSLLAHRCLQIVPDPSPEVLPRFAGMAQAKDLPILVAAVEAACPWLVTFNGRHFQPGHPEVTVLRPGEFVMRVRHLLAYLSRDK